MSMTQEQAVGLVAYLNRAGLVIAMEGQAAVWKDALYGVSYADAQEACRELVRKPDGPRILSPRDVYAEVKRLRRRRIADRVPPAPPVELSALDEIAFQRAFYRALGDGATEEQADGFACKSVGVERKAVTGPVRDPRRAIEQTADSMKRKGN